jgi:hypothetical protein
MSAIPGINYPDEQPADRGGALERVVETLVFWATIGREFASTARSESVIGCLSHRWSLQEISPKVDLTGRLVVTAVG